MFDMFPHTHFQQPRRVRPSSAPDRGHIRGNGATHRPGSAAEALHKQQQQHQLQQQQRQLQQQRAKAIQTLQAHGFHDRASIERAIERHGPNDLRACAQLLRDEEQQAQRQQKLLEAERQRQRERTRREAEAAIALQSPSIEESVEEVMSRETALELLLGAVRVKQSRKDVAAINKSIGAVERVLLAAQEEGAKWGPEILDEEWRECKMLNGVPVDLIGYEEGLLTLQMKLDGISAAEASSPAAKEQLRSMRKSAVKDVQLTLDKIDRCKQWWMLQTSASA